MRWKGTARDWTPSADLLIAFLYAFTAFLGEKEH